MYALRNLSIVCCLVMGLAFTIGCDKDDDMKPDTSTASFKGDFVASAHATSGEASVNADKTTLTFADFKTDSGPDLDIYLASSLNNVEADYLDLGDIQGLNGTYSYSLPANVDFSTYKYVVVWCVTFHVNFGYATLAPQ